MNIDIKKPDSNQILIILQLMIPLLLLGILIAQQLVPVVQAQAGNPQLILTKEIEGGSTTAQVGDVIRYRIRFECSSLVTACGQMEITDILQAGLIYLPPPNSSVPAGFTINYVPATRTITITKDDNNLLDGSQYDAVIAVRVDYDLRPLPAVINNTINGRVDPPGPLSWQIATPASAPQINVGSSNPYWDINKTLVSPRINPTVDTDVTYQIQLCPATPDTGYGNVPLQNVVILDTLPPGAVFVSASNGGDGLTVPGTVTWPIIAGPIYPPTCITRIVTVRYNSPTFSVGNTVINTAVASGAYRDQNGNLVGPVEITRDTITHTIDAISQVPSYYKDDVGDPVGINGTGRFILNLNTNGTNFPSNEISLIDNLPPELQATAITSGGWDVSFNNVRAYVEYSINNGSTYTAFPGQPVGYNTNALYPAPADNITNVRWRFEYDPEGDGTYIPGLPYTWSFTANPEIRVIPRTVPVPVPPLPVAVAGSTYNNCLQVSRRDNANVFVIDPCNIEPMTVQGILVSLRTYKNETPGTGWDDLDDPNINNFIPDTTILPGDTLRYTITVEVTERSSAALVNPTIQDTIPAGLIFVRNGTARLDGVALPAIAQPTFSQGGSTLTWEWNNPSPALTVNPLPLGSRYLTVEFFARVPRGQAPGTYTDHLYTVTDSVDALCETGTQAEDSANGDIDSDSDATDPACQTSDNYIVERSAALRGEKWIRSTDPANSQVVDAATFQPSVSCPDGGNSGLPGGGNNPFTRFPCIAQAYPEGALDSGQYVPPPTNPALDDFEYNLRIFNDGNVGMVTYVLYDILPYVGDTGSGGTLSASARQSEFRPNMLGPVQFVSGPAGLTAASFTVEYNNTPNPCRPEVFNQPVGAIVPAGCNNTWTTIWSSSARSYRIRLNSGQTIPSTATSPEVRFGVPMYIPVDSPVVGVADADDPLSLEVAWNSFAHVGAYTTVTSAIQDLLASEPRKVGITIPERMSVGNRVWRDSDNSGTINAPDDTTPGIAGVTVRFYRDTDNNGIPDGAAIATTLTDAGGYYLFSNIPYDAVTSANNRYLIGIPSGNFGAGQPLENLRSSTGTPAVPLYTNPPTNTTDSADDGIDPASPGLEVFSASFTLQPTTEPSAETDLSANNRDGPSGKRRGVNGERDGNSDLTPDFGFFGGTDVPFSIGNHVWYDNGLGGGVINDGIRNGTEPPVISLDVRLYRDGNGNNLPDTGELIRTDITDTNGFYLFDNLDPGTYFVEVPASEFGVGQPLAGWYSSQSTGTEDVGVVGNTNIPNMDSDDNGIDAAFPETSGIFSSAIVLTRGIDETINETHLSGQTDPSSPANATFNPTGWDGPASIGRFGETDARSNVTIDFGFIPPMSIGNRVWFDDGAGTTPFRNGYNNGLLDGTEAGAPNVRVELWRDTNATPDLQTAGDTLVGNTTTNAAGYYLFERLQPGSNYYVHIAAWNFAAAGRPLRNYISSYDANQTTAPADDFEDNDDNGIDTTNPVTNGITSSRITMAYNTEPLTPGNETDINTSGTYGPQNRGNLGQLDGDSNLTLDFGFVRPPRSIGNRLWLDNNNNGQVDAGEPAVPTGVRVSLYLDTNADNLPDDLGTGGDRTDDWIAWDTTDANGYYLFDKLPPNNYIVGVDRANFAAGGFLDEYTSSTGNIDNASNNTDNRDNGVDRTQPAELTLSPHGILSTRINLATIPLAGQPTGEGGSGDILNTLGFNPTSGDGTNSRGRFGETDANSDLTIDFGFFKPMSLGNRVFLDNGAGGGTLNDGIMNGSEPGVPNVRVELFLDANSDGVPDTPAPIAFDTTDANGYYLFDRLTAGNYIVRLPASNFIGAGVLLGLNSSLPTGTENASVAGNPYSPNTDRDDNGVNNVRPDLNGILSGTIVLALDTEPTGEAELSAQADPGAPGNAGFSPTGWDGPNSRGRWNNSDDNSNLTIDFGFIPPLSLGNRVWIDDGSSSTGLNLGQFNDGVMNGSETGRAAVGLNLYYDANDDGDYGDVVNGVNEATPVISTTTDAAGYYLFDRLAPGRYRVQVAPTNFVAGGALENYVSSTGSFNTEDQDINDNGIDSATYLVDGIYSNIFVLGYGSEPLTPTIETDIPANIPANTTTYGANMRGRFGETDDSSNLTLDFGFLMLRSLGNRVWLDDGGGDPVLSNNSLIDPGEAGIDGVLVSLYADNDGNGAPDGPALAVDTTSAGGYYLFSNLPAGQYIVGVDNSNFTLGQPLVEMVSSTDFIVPVDILPDRRDNGLDQAAPATAPNGVLSPTIDLRMPPPEPTGETDLSGRPGDGPFSRGTHGETDNQSDLTVDFGFVYPYSLGNRVWFDTNNNALIDSGEMGVDGVTVELYRADGTGNPTGLAIATALSASDATRAGYYLFDNLPPGNYVVVLPASNFTGTGRLAGYWSSLTTRQADGTNIETAAPDPNDGVDSDDNGTLLGGVVRSSAVTLGPNGLTEPLIEGDLHDTNGQGLQPDGRANMTVDFGFYRVSLGDLVFGDVNNNGNSDLGESLLGGVTVQLFAANGTTLIATTITDAGGIYHFDGLSAGDYIVRVTAPTASNSTRDDYNLAGDNANPNINSDNNDNGIGTGNGIVSAAVVTLTAGDAGALGSNSITNIDGTTHNPTVDFGFSLVYALGNRVWFDTNNNSLIDTGEVGIGGVTLVLYVADNSGNPTGGVLDTQITDANGYYLFNNLLSGDYVVVLPASNFGGVLNGTWSSASVRTNTGTIVETTAAAANLDIDSDDNGTLQTSGAFNGAILSSVVTLGPAGSAEPVNETDLGPGGQGQPDVQANTTVDFGFYIISLGNLVWIDADNSGAVNGTEAGIGGVDVELWSSDGTAPLALLATSTTNGIGLYSFTGLPAGDYIVRIPAREFEGTGTLRDLRSSTGGGTEPAPDADIVLTDSDDNGQETNGILGLGGYIQTQVITLTPAAEQSVNNAGGETVELRVDLGIIGGPQVDLSVTKDDGTPFYIAGGTLNYVIVVTNNGPADVSNIMVADTMPSQISSWVWTCDPATPAGYQCDGGAASSFSDAVNLPFGESISYNVFVQISSTAVGILDNTVTVTPPAGYSEIPSTPDNNTATDSDQPASLSITKDDGVSIVAPGAVLTYSVVVQNTGGVVLTDLTITDTLPPNVTFQRAFQGATPAPPTTIAGNVLTWDSTSISGLANLAVGASVSFDVVVQVNAAPVGTTIANRISAIDTPTGATSSTTDTDNIAVSNVKTLSGTSESGSGSAAPVNPEPVFIGEVLTYTIRLDVPAGTMNTLKALDILDSGLAFVRCVNISAGTLTTDLAGGFDAACSQSYPSPNPVITAEPVGDPTAVNQGRRILFDFGNVSSQVDETLTVTYEVIVLDVLSNVNGLKTLNNHVTWTWNSNSSLTGEATPLWITEPFLSITKSAQPTTAVYDSNIDFTLEIAHTAASTAPAFDVVVQDIIPAGLRFVPGSIVVTGLAPTSYTYDDPTKTIRLVWDTFPTASTAKISFKATFIGPSPVTNSASVEWTSLDLDFNQPPLPRGPVQRSPYNSSSTERWYDPATQSINNYRAISSIDIKRPEDLPDTGFAPNVVTTLSPQPASKAYVNIGSMRLEIPKLGLSTNITGVPFVNGDWDLTWLSNQAGYLAGTTFPGQVGTTGLTGHVTLADGTAGPFRNLEKLSWGDQIIMVIDGQRYIYELRDLSKVSPSDFSIFKNDGYTWLTLVTCKDYVPLAHTYANRTVVRAVLVRVDP